MELINKIKKRFNNWTYNLWIKIGNEHNWGNYYAKTTNTTYRPIGPGPKELKMIRERREKHMKEQFNKTTDGEAHETNSKFMKKKALQQPSKPLITKNNPKQDKKD